VFLALPEALIASFTTNPEDVHEKANREEVEYFDDAENTAAKEESTSATDRN
jgi:hypothetical protein